MADLLKLVVALSLTGLLLVSGFAGAAQDPQPTNTPTAYSDLIRMKSAMVGRWIGEAQYYDPKSAAFKIMRMVRNISQGPLAYTFHIEGTNEWEDGTTSAGYEVMGVRSDGALIRQLLFQNGQSTYKEEVILNYSIESDNQWTLTMLEYQQGAKGNDGPGVQKVVFEFNGDTWITTRSLAFGEPSGRKWEVRAQLQRQAGQSGKQ